MLFLPVVVGGQGAHGAQSLETGTDGVNVGQALKVDLAVWIVFYKQRRPQQPLQDIFLMYHTLIKCRLNNLRALDALLFLHLSVF